MDELVQNIKDLAEVYAVNLKGKIEARKEEMKADDNAQSKNKATNQLESCSIIRNATKL